MTSVVGLISGTSVDGIDAVLVEITGREIDLDVKLLAGETYPYPNELREQILEVCAGAAISLETLANLDDTIAFHFAQAAIAIQQNHPTADLIGSHGQTVYHRPPQNSTLGYSLQLGRGEAIAHLTNIPTISNFRAADIAAGGHGAPLVPKVDVYLFGHPTYSRCIQNIGGIGNVAYLPPTSQSEAFLGWDTGPGNSLLDLAVQHFSNGEKTYDKNGKWAATGTPQLGLVQKWLNQDYFQQLPPKSTGRELFGGDYFQQCLADTNEYNLNPANVLATLTELTVVSIVSSYRSFLPKLPDQVLLCGGGSRNLYLKDRLRQQLDPIPVMTTDEVGVSGDFKEAIAFAVLAYWRQLDIPGNLPAVTGASASMLLGDIH